MSGHVLRERDFGVQGEKEIMIVSSRSGEAVEATLFVEGKEKAVAKGVGENHFEAVSDLQDEVGYKHNVRQKEGEMRSYWK
jgi:hypothetical protein